MTHKVLVSTALDEAGISVLAAAPDLEFDQLLGLDEDGLAKIVSEYDALVVGTARVTARVLAAADRLRVIGRVGIGVGNVDVAAAGRRGIIVMNTPTGTAVTAAEHTLALLMAVARRITEADRCLKAGEWCAERFQGRELTGKVLGVIGLGSIGRLVASRAAGLQMRVLGTDPLISVEKAAELGVELVPLAELFSRADVITAHVPLTPLTKNMVDDAAIARMKPGVILVNTARGGVFDEAALLRGLNSGKLGGVGLDVFVQEPSLATELLRHPRATVTPHLGAASSEAEARMSIQIAEQVVAFLGKGLITNAINVTSVPQEIAARMQPYVDLADRLGRFLVAVENLRPRSVEIECSGALSELPTPPIVAAALARVLAASFEVPVNTVNAPLLARDRGIEVRSLCRSEPGTHTSYLGVTVRDAAGRAVVVGGTLGSDGSPRLVRWGGHSLDVTMRGTGLMLCNENRPGVIGTVGSLLGAAGINIERMQVALDDATGQSLSFWGLDSPVSDDLLEHVLRSGAVRSAFRLDFG